MSQQTEAIASAQSYSFATAQEMQDLYAAVDRRGGTPTAYIVDGDQTTLRKVA